MLTGSVCKYADFQTPWFAEWAPRVEHAGVIHRKVWEWAIQSSILSERDMLRPGRRGLGFAVGQEPLSSLYASLGANIDATDLFDGEVAATWAATDQHAADKDILFRPGIIDWPTFDERVNFFHADMNDLTSLPSETYDFLWSSCALEHLGSLEHGLRFVRDSMRLLKVGGVACHTTEFNVSDLHNTISEGGSVIYRESDIRQLGANLRKQCCAMEPMDFFAGDDPEDMVYFAPHLGMNPDYHLKLELCGFICTSAVLICRKYALPPPNA